jgi:hypothetical protein
VELREPNPRVALQKCRLRCIDSHQACYAGNRRPAGIRRGVRLYDPFAVDDESNRRLAEILGHLAVEMQAQDDTQSTLHTICVAAVDNIPGASWAGISLSETAPTRRLTSLLVSPKPAPDARAETLSQKSSVNQAAMSSRPRVNAGEVLGHAVEQVDVTEGQGGQQGSRCAHDVEIKHRVDEAAT